MNILILSLFCIPFMLIGCSSTFYVKHLPQYEKTDIPVPNNKLFSYIDENIEFRAKMEDYPLSYALIYFILYDKAERGFHIDTNSIIIYNAGLEKIDIRCLERIDGVQISGIPKNIPYTDYQSDAFLIMYRGDNIYYGQGIPLDNTKGRNAFKVNLDIIDSVNAFYKNISIYFYKNKASNKAFFAATEPRESFYSLNLDLFSEKNRYYRNIDCINSINLHLGIGNYQNSLNNGMVIVDSLTVTCLNTGQFFVPEVSDISRTLKETKYFFRNIEVPFDEDMIRIDFTIYLLDEGPVRKYHVQRYTRPVLVIPSSPYS